MVYQTNKQQSYHRVYIGINPSTRDYKFARNVGRRLLLMLRVKRQANESPVNHCAGAVAITAS